MDRGSKSHRSRRITTFQPKSGRGRGDDRATGSFRGERNPDRQLMKSDICAAVDSWRVYAGGDQSTLQGSTGPLGTVSVEGFNPAAPAFQPLANITLLEPTQQFTPYQPLRLVHNPARYPRYRVDKQYRFSDGNRERTILQNSAAQTDQSQQLQNQGHTVNSMILPTTASHSAAVESVETKISNIHITQLDEHEKKSDKKPSRVSRRPVSPPPAPIATEAYLAQAKLPPVRCGTPKNLLIVLDLNGTLLYRPDRVRRSTHFVRRPGSVRLLEYLFENHTVMVYTSAKPENASVMVQKMLTKKQRRQVAAIWARDKLGLTRAQYYEKVQVYKRLEPIWNDPDIRNLSSDADGWNQTNTIIIDDSHLKATAQPHNLVLVPEFNATTLGKDVPKSEQKRFRRQEKTVLQSLITKLEELKWQQDVSRVIRRWQTGEMETPKVPQSGILLDEKDDRDEERSTVDVASKQGANEMPCSETEESDEGGGVDLE